MTSRFMSRETRALKRAAAPLGAAEERRAVKAAVQRLMEKGEKEPGRRYRVLWVEVRINKADKAGTTPPRLIAVVIVDYDKRRNLEFLVDGAGKVAGESDLKFRPAFSQEEIKEARDIARQDERAAGLVKSASLTSTFGPHPHDGDGFRNIGLHFAAQRKARAELLGSVVVDLGERRVVSVQLSRAEERR